MNRKRNIQIGIALGILVVALVFVAMAASTGVGDASAGGGTGGGAVQINPKIPNPSAPALPAGFTKQQVQEAKDIVAKEQANITKKLSESGGIQSNQYGDGSFFVTWPFIDTQYNVYSYTKCGNPSCTYTYTVYPSLAIPLRTEVWNGYNFQYTGGYPPASGSYVGAYLYYWNYYTNSWTYEDAKYGYTDSNGEFRPGFIIPYRTYSDKYVIWEYVYNSQFTQWQQTDTKYIKVNWY